VPTAVADARDTPPNDAGSSDTGFADTGATVSRYAAQVLADGPSGYWRFEETSGTVAHDSSGHGHDGVYGASVVLGRAGLIGEGMAVVFDGADGGLEHFLQVPANVGLEPTANVTVEAWVLMNTPQPSGNLVSYGGDDRTAPFEAYVLGLTAGQPIAYLDIGNSGATVTAPGPISNTGAHHLVVVYDARDLHMYVDGEAFDDEPTTGPIHNYGKGIGLGIGSSFSGTEPTFAGAMDEVAIYASALTAEQVAAHYAAGTAK
jgi:hypothetical protein